MKKETSTKKVMIELDRELVQRAIMPLEVPSDADEEEIVDALREFCCDMLSWTDTTTMSLTPTLSRWQTPLVSMPSSCAATTANWHLSNNDVAGRCCLLASADLLAAGEQQSLPDCIYQLPTRTLAAGSHD